MFARRRLVLIVLGSCLALATGGAPGIGAGQPPTPSSEAPVGQPTALLVSATNAPLRVLGSDGLVHLEYDLLVTNVFGASAKISSVEVVSPDGRTLLQLADEALATVTEPLLGTTPITPAGQVPASGAVAVLIDFAVPPGQVPARLSHRIAYSLPPDAHGLAIIGSREVAGPELVVDPRIPVVIAPPLRSAGWFSLNGCCDPNAHRSLRLAIDGARVTKGEMFAVDWVQLRDGRYFADDGSGNEQHFAFGAEVMAVADGTVVFVRDDMPEETPEEAPLHVKQPIDYAGNQVVLQIAPDVWAIYAHLQTGSVGVRVGEQVTAGQVLGRLGNTGNTDAPHLHFELADNPDNVLASSLPFVLDRYTLAGTVAPEALEAAFSGADAPGPVAVTGPPQPQSGTHPLHLTVSDFR